MLRAAYALTLLAASASLVRAAVPQWGQCGGISYTGDTTCASGSVCTRKNDYYSQCLPGTATTNPSSVTTPPPSSASSTTTNQPSTSAPSTSATSAPAPTGFVGVSGQKFVLDGKTFTVVGLNSYWVGLMGYSHADIDKAFADIASTGATAVRTLGFNDVTSPNGIYYQLWNGSTPAVNTGLTGLQNFDYIVASARAHGLRLIITLTNNWSDYGGMDVYVKQILGSANHDLFYTNAQVIAAYKNYVKAFVGRYVSPYQRTTTGTCTTTTVTNWISDASAYIKSIDPNHLVAVGDEGFFNEPSNPSYPYQGSEGIDFNANLAVKTIDFGTFHLYPEGCGQTSNPSSTVWGSQWIADHVTSQKSANKPVIVEEFGVTSNQSAVYTVWYSDIVSSGLTGDLIWQAGSHLSVGDTPNDGYAVYPDGPVYPIITQHTAALKARG